MTTCWRSQRHWQTGAGAASALHCPNSPGEVSREQPSHPMRTLLCSVCLPMQNRSQATMCTGRSATGRDCPAGHQRPRGAGLAQPCASPSRALLVQGAAERRLGNVYADRGRVRSSLVQPVGCPACRNPCGCHRAARRTQATRDPRVLAPRPLAGRSARSSHRSASGIPADHGRCSPCRRDTTQRDTRLARRRTGATGRHQRALCASCDPGMSHRFGVSRVCVLS